MTSSGDLLIYLECVFAWCGEVVVHMFGSLIWKVQQYPMILATVIEFVWNAIAAARKKESSEGDSNVIQLL